MTEPSRDIMDLRREIDRLDEQLIDLLAARMRVAREVAAYKMKQGIPVRLADRIAAVLQRCARIGGERGLDPAYVQGLWSAIIEETCRIEEGLVARSDAGE